MRSRDGGLRSTLARVSAVAIVQAFAVGWLLHSLHADPAESHEAVYIQPTLHWLRDSALSVPGAIAFLMLATALARRLVRRRGWDGDGFGARVLWALVGAAAYAAASVPGALVHDHLFVATHEGSSFVVHSLEEAMITARYAFVLLVLFAGVWGVPWRQVRKSTGAGGRRIARAAGA